MAAYATHSRELDAPTRRTRFGPGGYESAQRLQAVPDRAGSLELSIIDHLVDRLAERVAALLSERLPTDDRKHDEWLDSRHAAEYLGVHRDTLRKLAAERALPSEQDGPGCKLYFRRSDLDVWRRGGGAPRRLAAIATNAA